MRAPFDLVEAEQELTAGYMTEYSGMKFALFYMAEYIKMIVVSALFTTFFLGGWSGPFVEKCRFCRWAISSSRCFCACAIFIWVRASLPRISLRPPDGLWLEDAAAHCVGKCGGHCIVDCDWGSGIQMKLSD